MGSANTPAVVDDLAPIRAWIDPSEAAAFGAFEMGADIVQ